MELRNYLDLEALSVVGAEDRLRRLLDEPLLEALLQGKRLGFCASIRVRSRLG